MTPDKPELGKTLLILARNAIADKLGIAHTADPQDARLDNPGASFVTLTEDGRLRGCIGSLEAWRKLGDDVRANACAAAFRDPRFLPLGREEFDKIRVEVSLLTPARPMTFVSENDALRQLRPDIDGLILEYGNHRATFLPQVWESLPDPSQFMAELKYKAGLPADFWHDELRLSRYEVQKWKE